MSFNKNSKWFASGLVLVGIVVGVALVSAGTAVVHWSGSTQFCGTFCHSMDRVYAAYQHGLHGKTNVGVEVGCVDCHLKYESEKSISQAQVVGLLWHKAMSGSSSLWGEIRGTMSTPEKQKAMQNELSEKYLKWARSTGFQNCRGCHDLNNFKVNPAKPMVCCAGSSSPSCRPAAGILPPPPSCCAVWIARWNGWPSSPASTSR